MKCARLSKEVGIAKETAPLPFQTSGSNQGLGPQGRSFPSEDSTIVSQIASRVNLTSRLFFLELCSSKSAAFLNVLRASEPGGQAKTESRKKVMVPR